MKRKTIAVCVTGYDQEYETKVVEGIVRKARALDVNVTVFASLMRRPEFNSGRTLPASVLRGETSIFKLINYKLADGVIILGDSIIDEKVIGEITEKAHEHNIPVININDENHKLDKNIILSDKYAMEFVVRHFVEEHGLKKINFIGGFPGNLQTEERLAAYKKVLEENGIPFEEKRVAYGEFWKKSAECTREFIESGDIPQAIVCASDTMAFFCMDQLKQMGLRIPEDIIVTGFDGIKDCELYSPSLTTVRRGFSESGVRAVEILADIWSGKDCPDKIYVDSVLVKQQSCGCKSKNEQDDLGFYGSKYGGLNTFMEFTTKLMEMNTMFAGVRNSRELFETLNSGAAFFRFRRLYVCICSEIEKGGSFTVGSSAACTDGRVMSMMEYGHSTPFGTEFLSSELIPEKDFLYGEKAVFYAFSPLYFNDKIIGYAAYEPTRTVGAGDFFGTWLTAISNNIGNFYMKKDLELVVKKLEDLNVRDPLTELYNRRGMEKFGGEAVRRAKESDLPLTVICADIDGLKPINDKWGHEAGDNAIKQTAEAISRAMPLGSVCTRTGGDEFSIIICGASESEITQYINKVAELLLQYNSESGLPYKVGCSCGFCTVRGSKLDSAESIAKLADENMYRVKLQKKVAQRSSEQ